MRTKKPKPTISSREEEVAQAKANIMRPGLFSRPRSSNLVNTIERRTSEERSLVQKYLDLADLALKSDLDDEVKKDDESPSSDKVKAA